MVPGRGVFPVPLIHPGAWHAVGVTRAFPEVFEPVRRVLALLRRLG